MSHPTAATTKTQMIPKTRTKGCMRASDLFPLNARSGRSRRGVSLQLWCRVRGGTCSIKQTWRSSLKLVVSTHRSEPARPRGERGHEAADREQEHARLDVDGRGTPDVESSRSKEKI